MPWSATPILITRDPERSIAFYLRLGFALVAHTPPPEAYLIFRREGLELHFTQVPADHPSGSDSAVYLRVPDVDALHREWQALDLPAQGTPCLAPPRDLPWRMREAHLVDPDGHLLRIGQPIAAPATAG